MFWRWLRSVWRRVRPSIAFIWGGEPLLGHVVAYLQPSGRSVPECFGVGRVVGATSSGNLLVEEGGKICTPIAHEHVVSVDGRTCVGKEGLVPRLDPGDIGTHTSTDDDEYETYLLFKANQTCNLSWHFYETPLFQKFLAKEELRALHPAPVIVLAVNDRGDPFVLEARGNPAWMKTVDRPEWVKA